MSRQPHVDPPYAPNNFSCLWRLHPAILSQHRKVEMSATVPSTYAGRRVIRGLRALVVSLSRCLLAVSTVLFMACDGSAGLSAPANESARFTSENSAQRDSQPRLVAMAHPRRIPGSFVVRLHSDTRDLASVARLLMDRHNGKVVATLKGLHGFWGQFPDEAVDALLGDVRVRSVEADISLSASGIGDTTQFSPPDALDRMDQRYLPLNGTYEWSTDGSGVHLWIVDNGVDSADSQLSGRVSNAYSFRAHFQNPFVSCPGDPHGTDMARAAAGRTLGIARNATIYSARVNVLDDCGAFSGASVAAALEFIAQYSPRPAVANVSANVFCHPVQNCPTAMEDAAIYAHDQGVTVVVAAGNDGLDACLYLPSRVGKLITVGAVGISGQRQPSSNYGSCVDIWAVVGQGGTFGTSTAAAYVSGAAALKLQLTSWLPPSAVASQLTGNATVGVLSDIGSSSPNLLLYTRQAALTVAIAGPFDQMGPSSSCSWAADISGGQPPFSYLWKRNEVQVSTYSYYDLSPVGSADFGLTLDVVDGVGRTASAGQSIFVDPNYWYPWCGGF